MDEQTAPHTGPLPGETEEDQTGIPEFQRTPGKAEGEDPDDPQGEVVPPPPTEAG